MAFVPSGWEEGEGDCEKEDECEVFEECEGEWEGDGWEEEEACEVCEECEGEWEGDGWEEEEDTCREWEDEEEEEQKPDGIGPLDLQSETSPFEAYFTIFIIGLGLLLVLVLGWASNVVRTRLDRSNIARAEAAAEELLKSESLNDDAKKPQPQSKTTQPKKDKKAKKKKAPDNVSGGQHAQAAAQEMSLAEAEASLSSSVAEPGANESHRSGNDSHANSFPSKKLKEDQRQQPLIGNYCAHCDGLNATKKCGGCSQKYYCDRICQSAHWNSGGHRMDCARLQLKKKADMVEAAEPSERPDASEEYLCPISKDVMEDPVLAADGITYERSAIEKWIRDKEDELCTARRDISNCDATARKAFQRIIDTGVKSPIKGTPLLSLNLVPNEELALKIHFFRYCRRESGIDRDDSGAGSGGGGGGGGGGCTATAAVAAAAASDNGGGGGGSGSGGGIVGSGGGRSRNDQCGTIDEAETQEQDLTSILLLNGFEDVAAVFIDEEFDAGAFLMLKEIDLIDMKAIPASRHGALLQLSAALRAAEKS